MLISFDVWDNEICMALREGLRRFQVQGVQDEMMSSGDVEDCFRYETCQFPLLYWAVAKHIKIFLPFLYCALASTDHGLFTYRWRNKVLLECVIIGMLSACHFPPSQTVGLWVNSQLVMVRYYGILVCMGTCQFVSAISVMLIVLDVNLGKFLIVHWRLQVNIIGLDSNESE